MKAASTEWVGIFPRVISKGMVSSPRCTVTVTWVPALPFILRTMLSCGNCTPAITVVSTLMSLSPGWSPIFSDGPPGITSITTAVSLGTLNCMPIPSKLPARSSSEASSVRGSMYTEWGSRAERAAAATASVTFLWSTEST